MSEGGVVFIGGRRRDRSSSGCGGCLLLLEESRVKVPVEEDKM